MVGVHRKGGAGQTVRVARDYYSSLIAPGSLPARVAVARARHVIARGVIQTVANLATAVAIRARRTFLFTVTSHEASTTGALSGDVITVCSVPTVADLSTVFPIETQQTALRAVKARPAGCTLAFPVVCAAAGPVVAVACVDAVWTPLTWRARLGAVTSDPSWVTLARSVDGVTGAVVGAAAAPGAVLPIPAAGAHLIAKRPFEPGQAVALARKVVTRSSAVDTMGAGLAATVAKVAR